MNATATTEGTRMTDAEVLPSRAVRTEDSRTLALPIAPTAGERIEHRKTTPVPGTRLELPPECYVG
jgi:hypothetical protein